MDLNAPAPSENPVKKSNTSSKPSITQTEETNTVVEKVELYSNVSVSLIGVGGMGLNGSRMVKEHRGLTNTLYFDTSMNNSRPGEKVFIIGDGNGSGSLRAENAREMERQIPQISDDQLGVANVAIVVFSLAGGSGSTAGPLLIREYAKRGVRPIGVVVADTTSAVGAKNTLNTLKTLTAIAKNNDIYLPLIVLTNDDAPSRQTVNDSAANLISALIDTLTKPVYEVDRNDRLNWVDPTKVTGSAPGLKIMSFISDKNPINEKVVLGTKSTEMVDSLLVLRSSADEPMRDNTPIPMARLKKEGFYHEAHHPIIAKVSSDITSINAIIDKVEKMQHQEKAQKHQTVDRLSLDDHNGDDLIL
jgi:hypothetical protein